MQKPTAGNRPIAGRTRLCRADEVDFPGDYRRVIVGVDGISAQQQDRTTRAPNVITCFSVASFRVFSGLILCLGTKKTGRKNKFPPGLSLVCDPANAGP
jgi:hypothetical protein